MGKGEEADKGEKGELAHGMWLCCGFGVHEDVGLRFHGTAMQSSLVTAKQHCNRGGSHHKGYIAIEGRGQRKGRSKVRQVNDSSSGINQSIILYALLYLVLEGLRLSPILPKRATVQ